MAVFNIYRFSRKQLGQIRISPDNRHIAYIYQASDELKLSCVKVDQKPGELFPSILLDTLTFSPDSRRVSYGASDFQGQFLIIDNKKHGPYKGLIACSPAFSPDSKQVVYAVHTKDKNTVSVFIDENLLCTCDKIGDTLQFSPDGTSLAFKASVDGKQCVMVNGQQGPFYDQVDNPHFSPDSQRTTYMAKQDGQWFIVIDGEEGQRFKNAVGPVFSPNSERIAYYAQGDDGWYMAADDQLIGPYHSFGREEFGLFNFSPDSQRLAFVGVEAKKWLMISYRHRESVVTNGEHGRKYNRCVNLVFSPNSEHLAYAAKRDDHWFIIVDDEEFGPYESIEQDRPVFSPDGRQVGFAGCINGRWSPFINGVPCGEYDLAWNPTFAPDNRSYAAVTQLKGKGACLLVNDAPGEHYYDGIFIKQGGGRIVFDSPNMLQYIASPKNSPDHWYLVTETLS